MRACVPNGTGIVRQAKSRVLSVLHTVSTQSRYRDSARVGSVEAEDEALDAVGVAGAGDAEGAYLAGAGYVGAGAEALVVVADADYAHCVGGAVGEAAEVESLHGFGLGDVFVCHGYVGGDNAVDVGFEAANIALLQRCGEVEVEFRFLAFDVGAECASAAVAACHLSVEQMLGGVHRRVFLLVVVVELWCVHCGGRII